MSVVKEIEDYKKEIQRISEKTAQAMRIRTKLVVQRNEAIKKYAALSKFPGLKLKIEKELAALQKCFKNEKRFIDILNNGLNEGVVILERTKLMMKKLKVKREVIHNIKVLLWILEYTQSKIKKIKSRMKKEERFLETYDINDFDAFKKSWDKERRYDLAIAEKLNPKRINKVNDYVDKLTKAVEEGTAGAFTGAFGGAFIGLFQAAVFGSASGGNNKLWIAMIAFWSAFIGICTLVSGMSSAISEHEQKLFEIQQPAMLKIKTAV